MPGMAELFTKKIGPLPVWGWMGIGTAGMLALGSAGKGKSKQGTSAATPQPPNDTQGPANALGQFGGGVLGGGMYGGGRSHGMNGGGAQWTAGGGGGGGQYGHTGFPSFGNGWTGRQGHLSHAPAQHGIRHGGMRHGGPGAGAMPHGHSGGWGGHGAGSGQHGIGGGSHGIGGIGHPHQPSRGVPSGEIGSSRGSASGGSERQTPARRVPGAPNPNSRAARKLCRTGTGITGTASIAAGTRASTVTRTAGPAGGSWLAAAASG